MADLTTSSCCSEADQAACCEPSEKAACCGASAAGQACGCTAGQATETEIRETVRERYAAAARAMADRQPSSCGCGSVTTTDAAGVEVFGGALYDDAQTEGATATVLDLGSGAGADVLISARRVGTTGKAIGDVEIRSTHRVHEHAASAIIRARKPA